WGGNFADFVRSRHYLRIVEQNRLVENARRQGEFMLTELHALAEKHPVLSAVRGRGLFLAFDLPNAATREAFWKRAYDVGLLVLRCGDRSIRLRPVLDVTTEICQKGLQIIESVCERLEC